MKQVSVNLMVYISTHTHTHYLLLSIFLLFFTNFHKIQAIYEANTVKNLRKGLWSQDEMCNKDKERNINSGFEWIVKNEVKF